MTDVVKRFREHVKKARHISSVKKICNGVYTVGQEKPLAAEIQYAGEIANNDPLASVKGIEARRVGDTIYGTLFFGSTPLAVVETKEDHWEMRVFLSSYNPDSPIYDVDADGWITVSPPKKNYIPDRLFLYGIGEIQQWVDRISSVAKETLDEEEVEECHWQEHGQTTSK